MLQRFQNRVFRHFLILDPAFRIGVDPEHIAEMPCDCLSLTVRVGRKKDGIRLRRQFLQIGKNFFRLRLRFVGNGELILHIHAERLLADIPDVSFRRDYLVVAPEIMLNRLCLCRGLNNH